ncbi:MAG: hypothetical protein HC906_09230 [Bacteroidales bacterium]|nr:hypothetical protein [Bacteroidales bacterium]
MLVIYPEQFVNEVLDPKIQEIVRGKFYINAFDSVTNKFIYTSEKQYVPDKIIESKPFWLLQGYKMGIELKDLTIADLTQSRLKRNIFLIFLIDTVLLLTAYIIFRNIKKQIELTQMKSDFVSSVSHEIRTPLALISMYIETLEMGRIKTEEKVKEYYSVIMNETQRLSGMVNRILSFLKLKGIKENMHLIR